MHRVLVLYGQPADPDQFRSHYEQTHIPLAKKIPGLQAMHVAFDVTSPRGPSPYFCTVELDFEDAGAMAAGLGSPEGQAAAADVVNFAPEGATLVSYDVNNV
jgi:uncharacterized protein (TIGR02118 family)